MRRHHLPADPALNPGPFTFGLELIMDIDGCDPAIIADPEALRRYTDGMVELLGMTKYGDLWLHHFGHATPETSGYTVFQAIETSSIIVHVSEGLTRVHANVFSCRPFDPDAAVEYSERYFRGTDTTFTVLSR